MATKTVRELSGVDIGKTVTISPQPGITVTDELRSVIHGDAAHHNGDASVTFVTFKNVASRRAFEFNNEGFKFDGSDKVEVH